MLSDIFLKGVSNGLSPSIASLKTSRENFSNTGLLFTILKTNNFFFFYPYYGFQFII